MKASEIFMLVGPKGAGKSFIGKLLEQQAGIHFIQVDDIWLELKKHRTDFGSDECRKEAARIMYERVESSLKDHNQVSLESTAVGYGKLDFINSLRNLAKLHLIKVHAPREVCLERIHNRDNSGHTPMEDEKIDSIYSQFSRLDLPWDLVLENHPFLKESEITSAINSLSP